LETVLLIIVAVVDKVAAADFGSSLAKGDDALVAAVGRTTVACIVVVVVAFLAVVHLDFAVTTVGDRPRGRGAGHVTDLAGFQSIGTDLRDLVAIVAVLLTVHLIVATVGGGAGRKGALGVADLAGLQAVFTGFRHFISVITLLGTRLASSQVDAKMAITTASGDTIAEAGIGVAFIAVIAGLKPSLALHHIESLDSIAAAGRLTGIGTGIRIDVAAVITALHIGVNGAVAATGRLAVHTGVRAVLVAIIANFVGFFVDDTVAAGGGPASG